MKVGIVGGGVHGLCTARSLVQRGHAVTVFEQIRPGNDLGSTVGRSRIVRQAYPDQFYTELLLEGHALWHKLEADSGQKLIHEVGLLFVGPHSSPSMHHELDTLEHLRVPHKVHTPETIRQVHSHMVLAPDEVAVMTLSAGWADVPRVLESLQGLILSRGGALRTERITDLAALSKEFDAVVVAAGAWVTKFFDLPLRVTLQTAGYVGERVHGPVFIESFGDEMYGFPSEPGVDSFKIGCHTRGAETDPDSPDRDSSEEALKAVSECALRRFGVNAPIVETQVCLYTSTPSEDFRFAWADESTLVASPCSGHGFKFGPWVGEFVCALLEGTEKLADWPRFAF